jgi:hypothetical protein
MAVGAFGNAEAMEMGGKDEEKDELTWAVQVWMEPLFAG